VSFFLSFFERWVLAGSSVTSPSFNMSVNLMCSNTSMVYITHITGLVVR
jgi:hypothetical protein